MIEVRDDSNLAKNASVEILAGIAKANNNVEVISLECNAHALMWRLEMGEVFSSLDTDNFRVLLKVGVEKRLKELQIV